MFPGATADRADADYVVVGAPLDVSTTFQPGTRFGPDRVRRFAETFDDYDRRTGRSFSDLAVHDAGDVRAWDDAPEYLEYLEGTCRDAVWDDAVPLLIGGEHTVTSAAARAVDPDVVVVVDAHLDLRAEYDGNPWSHATVTRRLLDGDPAVGGGPTGTGAAEDAEREEANGPVDEAVIVGARTGSEAEWERAARDDVTVVPPEDAAGWEPDFDDDATAYLSVDVDGADPAFAPGTGTMEPFGLAPREMRDVVRSVAPRAAGFDVVEVNDRDDGQAASLAGKLLREFVYAHADGR
jgi:agmatinase